MAGRRPNASGQMMTAGCVPVVGWLNAASHVPSGVLISTIVSTTGTAAAAGMPAATTPAARPIATKSRRESSLSCCSGSYWSCVCCVMECLLLVRGILDDVLTCAVGRSATFIPPSRHYGSDERRTHWLAAERSADPPAPLHQDRTVDARLPAHAEAAQHARAAPLLDQHGPGAREGREDRHVRRGVLDEGHPGGRGARFQPDGEGPRRAARRLRGADRPDERRRLPRDRQHVRHADVKRCVHREPRPGRLRRVSHADLPLPEGLRPRRADHGEPLGRRRSPARLAPPRGQSAPNGCSAPGSSFHFLPKCRGCPKTGQWCDLRPTHVNSYACLLVAELAREYA